MWTRVRGPGAWASTGSPGLGLPSGPGAMLPRGAAATRTDRALGLPSPLSHHDGHLMILLSSHPVYPGHRRQWGSSPMMGTPSIDSQAYNLNFPIAWGRGCVDKGPGTGRLGQHWESRTRTALGTRCNAAARGRSHAHGSRTGTSESTESS